MAKEFRENFVGVLTLVIVSLAIYGFLRVSSRTAIANPNSPTRHSLLTPAALIIISTLLSIRRRAAFRPRSA